MKKKFLSEKKWFFEDFKLQESPTFTWGVLPEKEIYFGKSKFQEIEVFETEVFGKILVIDGLIQLSTKHEFVYHEMLIHPALFSHPKPEKVLIIGGGDGGALREVVKHPVKEVFLVDIDQKIIEVSKKYLPSVSNGAFGDKRVKVFIDDGLKFIKKYNNYFDIIINDSTDPEGASKSLWEVTFYKDISKALKEKGVAAFQTAYFQEKFAQKARRRIRSIFPFFSLRRAFVGCFPFDEHTFSFGSKRLDFNKISPMKIKKRYKKLNLNLKYYSPQIHFASEVLPKYLKEKIKK